MVHLLHFFSLLNLFTLKSSCANSGFIISKFYSFFLFQNTVKEGKFMVAKIRCWRLCAMVRAIFNLNYCWLC